MNKPIHDFLEHLRHERNYTEATCKSYQYDLEKFFDFMQGVAEREITSTEQLLKYAEDTLGRDVKDWIENRIKS